MKIELLHIPGPILLRPRVFGDDRGFFLESFNEEQFSRTVGHEFHFVQDNHSRSGKGVLRGLHYQTQFVQGKLVRVVEGRIFDVAVDLRPNSPWFGDHVSVELSSSDKAMLWIPPGFAHGFLTLSERADVLYKATAYYAPTFERSLLWSDPALNIAWPLNGIEPLLSEKDSLGKPLCVADPIVEDFGQSPLNVSSGAGSSHAIALA